MFKVEEFGMKAPCAMLALVIAAAAIGGCLQYGGEAPPPTTPPVVPPTTQSPPVQPQPEKNVTLSVIYAPTTAKAGDTISFTWKVDGPEVTIPHTSIHYDYVSHPGTFGTGITPNDGGYSNLITDFASGSFSIPGTFTGNITVSQAGAIYYRAHAIVGDKNYWTAERGLIVEEPKPPVQLQSFTIEADDNGFYINNAAVSTIYAARNSTVDILFKVRTAGVSYGALSFQGCGQGLVSASAGSSTRIRFTAGAPCTITSYATYSSAYGYNTISLSRIQVCLSDAACPAISGGGGY